MAKTKAKTETTPKAPPPEPEPRLVPPGGFGDQDLSALEGDIDSRMKALLKDHQAMGARPK